MATAAAVVGAGAAVFGASEASKNAQNAQDAQEDQNALNAAGISKAAAQARKDALLAYGAAAPNREMGFEAALNSLMQSGRGQLQAGQQGNMAAQNQLLQGLPQMQNALLGLPVDMSGMQPQQIGYNTQFLTNQLPDFQGPNEVFEYNIPFQGLASQITQPSWMDNVNNGNLDLTNLAGLANLRGR